MAFEWLIGLGFMFGFGLALTFLQDVSIESFLGFETLMSAFVVWWDYLPLWVLIVNLLVLVFIVITEIKNRSL